ncbi:MAG: hypothetical protein AB2A00_19085 [Myxococcota bacterium]
MRADPLTRLRDTARSLPGEKAPLPPVVGPLADDGPADAQSPVDVPALRRRVHALIKDLAAALEPALKVSLEQAARSWDQADALTVLDGDLRNRAVELRLHCQTLCQHPEPTVAAVALEAMLTVDAVVGLVALLERRLATLVRLRLRSEQPELLEQGRPFLDVAAALEQAGRAWT